ncbi:MAG: hypothetical protein L0Z62_20830 [Gemmataceae bacterium]|nr:hypothetical protein [Gemmataceae bacterium]
MIIWSGWGFLVAVIGLACLVATQLGVNAAMQDDQYYQTNGWPKLVGLFLVAALLWPVGRTLNRQRQERELVDPATGERVVLHSGGGHTFFFIPVEYWAPICLVLGVIFLFVK